MRNNNYQSRGVSLKLIAWIISAFAVIFSALLIVSLQLISYEDDVVNETYKNYLSLKEATTDVQLASDYLTEQVRLFVANEDKKYMDNYFEEANVTKRRENALITIHELAENTPSHEEIHNNITLAVNESIKLMDLEYFAMKLICVDANISYAEYPEVGNANIDNVSPENRKSAAIDAVLGTEYIKSKDYIISHVDAAIAIIDNLMEENVNKSVADLKNLIRFQTIVIIIVVSFTALGVVFMHIFIIAPMNSTIKALSNNEEVHVFSNKEFNYMADTYNEIHRQNETVKEKLIYEAEHDKLTGLYNRTGYDALFRKMNLSDTIYILLDIDKFKEVNDNLGHEIGDKVIIRSAQIMNKYFPEDNAYVSRIGGDEFAILIETANEDMRTNILKRCKSMIAESSKNRGIIPGVTFSIGIATGDIEDTRDTLFKKADIALYNVKKSGRSNAAIYEKKEN